jgi:hypothetical protein
MVCSRLWTPSPHFAYTMPKNKLISVSSSITRTRCKLWVAQNGPVPDKVLSQLRKIWGRLQDIGNALASADDNPEKESPDLTADSVAFEHESQLREDIYTFSFAKIQRRILQKSDDWKEVLGHMQEYRDPHDDTVFPRLGRHLTLLFRLTRHATASRTPIKAVSKCAQLAYVAFSPLLLNVSPLSALGTFARLLPSKPIVISVNPAALLTRLSIATLNFPLRHRLEKIFSVEDHIESIMKFAISPRLRPYMAMKLDVEPVPPPAKTRAESFDIRRATLRTRISECVQLIGGDPSDDELEAAYDRIISNIKNSPNFIGDMFETPGCQHAECTILLHHLQNPETSPYNYFGVSKLSCVACHLFFAMYRQTVEIRNWTGQFPRFPPYFTRGTHKKLYPGWSMPDLDTLTKLGLEEISTAMTQSLK